MPFSNPQEMGRPITIRDEGVTIASNVSSINFTGSGVSGSAVGAAVTEDVSGGSGGGTSLLYFEIDGGGSAIEAGTKFEFSLPFAGTITANRVLAKETGSIVFDIWKDTYANYPPTVADSITASAKPTISSGVKSEDTTLTGWTTPFAAGDTFIVNVDSCSGMTRCALLLTITK